MNLRGFFSAIFGVQEIQGINNIEDIVLGLSDQSIRNHWLREILNEIQNINISIDTDLVQNKQYSFEEKSARRRALQFVLEQVLSSKREVEALQKHNPVMGGFAVLK